MLSCVCAIDLLGPSKIFLLHSLKTQLFKPFQNKKFVYPTQILIVEYRILVDIDHASKTGLSLEWRQQRMLAGTYIFGLEN